MLSSYEPTPSLICMDLCNLERDVKRLQKVGCQALHIDMIDGRFSPIMPIGLDMVRQLRRKTDLVFDAHLMTTYNNFFVDELIQIGCERICFQVEGEPSVGPLLKKIHAADRKAGLALCPGTPVSTLEYLIEECDYVLVMRLDPGYAHLKGTDVKPYMDRKIDELFELIRKRNPSATVAVDGHVGFEDFRPLRAKGVSTYVCGTKSLFNANGTLEENWSQICALLAPEA